MINFINCKPFQLWLDFSFCSFIVLCCFFCLFLCTIVKLFFILFYGLYFFLYKKNFWKVKDNYFICVSVHLVFICSSLIHQNWLFMRSIIQITNFIPSTILPQLISRPPLLLMKSPKCMWVYIFIINNFIEV